MSVSPVILNKLPFDAEGDLKIQFTYSGSQVYAYRVIIQDNATNDTVYDEKTSGQNGIVLSSIATIPANTLTNGYSYNFQISVFDYEDTESPLSNIVVLKALKTPVFQITNLSQNDIVRNSYCNINISYSQENGELLNVFIVNLYSAEQMQIWTSGTLYAGTETVQVSNLLDNTTYYIQATGSTVNGIKMTTDLIQFSCDYVTPDLFLTFRAENIPEEGAVKLSSNFVLVEGKSDSEDLIYIDDEKVSLLNGEKVWFDEGYSADSWVCEIKVSNLLDFTKFATFDLQSAKVYLTWCYGNFIGCDELVNYVLLTAYSYVNTEPLNYIQQSNKIPVLAEGQPVFIFVKHMDGIFDLQIEALPITEEEAIADEEGGVI